MDIAGTAAFDPQPTTSSEVKGMCNTETKGFLYSFDKTSSRTGPRADFYRWEVR